MTGGKWVVPAVLFFAGAVFERVFGLKPLLRGAMTVASMGGLVSDAGHRRAPACKIAHRKISHGPARKRAPAKRSRVA